MTTMAPTVLTVLPTRGERGRGAWARPVTAGSGPGVLPAFDLLAQAGRAAEIATLGGVVAPYDPAGEESWGVAGDQLRHSRWSQVIVQFPTTFATPVYAAKVSATLQRFSAGRLGWWLAPDADESPLGFADVTADRWARAEEFLSVARGVWSGGPFDFDGEHYQVLGGGFGGPATGLPFPRIHLSGRGRDALELAARHGDVHVFTPETGLAASVAELRELAAAAGRTVEIALQLSVLAREDAADLAHALDSLDLPAVDRADVEPPGGRRPGLWRDFTKVDETGTATERGLAGTYSEVADVLRGYAELGVSTFVLDLRPSIEETYRFGEHLAPLLDTPQSGSRPAEGAPHVA